MIRDVKQHTPLVLRREIKRPSRYAQFIIGEDFEFSYSVHTKKRRFTVPAGFETDLSSVPRIFRGLVSKTDLIECSVIHDWLYSTQAVPRPEADAAFNAFGRDAGHWFRAPLAYLGVRLGGWFAYRK